MAKIDQIKEKLTSLRVGLSLIVGLIVVVTGALIQKEQNDMIDIYFWLGLGLDIILLLIFISSYIGY
ncbi:MAG: hypothetical protein ACLFOC_05795 [Campylobacterales bacterium]